MSAAASGAATVSAAATASVMNVDASSGAPASKS